MKLNDYFPRWRVELKWWRIVAWRTFIGWAAWIRRKQARSYRAACAARPPASIHPSQGRAFFNSQGWCRRVRSRRAGRSPLSFSLRTLISCSSGGVPASSEKISENYFPPIWIVWIKVQELTWHNSRVLLVGWLLGSVMSRWVVCTHLLISGLFSDLVGSFMIFFCCCQI